MSNSYKKTSFTTFFVLPIFIKVVLLQINLKKTMKKFLLLVATAFCLHANAQIITTVAGTGTHGYSGDGDLATNANLGSNSPTDVVMDGAGNLFICDRSNGRIRKISNDTITTVASGLNYPNSIAVDTAGNLYIAANDSKVYKLNKNGFPSYPFAIAGTGATGYSGDGGQATAAVLGDIEGIAVDISGNVYISDHYKNVIRKIDTITGIISTVAGTGVGGHSGDGGQAIAAQLFQPYGMAFSPSGNLFFVEDNGGNIRQIDLSTGIISAVAGNNYPGYSSSDGTTINNIYLSNPTDIGFDADGNIYVCETGYNRIRKIDGYTGILSTVAGNATAGYSGDGGTGIAAKLNKPTGIFVTPIGDVYIADSYNQRTRKVTCSVPALNLSVINPVICKHDTTSLMVKGATSYTWSPAASLSANNITNPVSNATTTTNYTVTGKNACGTSSDTITIKVNSLPHVSVVASASICVNVYDTLRASGATYYDWHGDNFFNGSDSLTIDYNFQGITSYTVIGTNIYNCKDTVRFKVNAFPTPTITVNNPSVCYGDTAIVNAAGGVKYNWWNGDTTSSIKIFYTGIGTYNNYGHVTGVDVHGCVPQNSAYFNLTVNQLPNVYLTSTTSWGSTICALTTPTLTGNGASTYAWSDGATTAINTPSPTDTTTYVVIGTDANGCTGKDSILINVYALPTINVVSTATAICVGSTTTLTASGTATSYTWNTSATTASVVVTPTTTAAYTVTGTDANGCENTAVSTMTINALPNNATTLNGVVITATQVGATYQWINCANNTAITGATTQSYTATVNGNYKVRVSNGTCSDTSACVSVTTVGIDTYLNTTGVSVYPNPSNGTFVVTTTEHTKTILVTDILGNEILAVTPNNNTTTTISLNTQANGIYFVKIITDNAQIIKRMVINN